MPTLKDIADKAGVSVATVSRVLSGNETYSFAPETVERILQLADELGYRPPRNRKTIINRPRFAMIMWYREEEEHLYTYYSEIRLGAEKKCRNEHVEFQKYYTVESFLQGHQPNLYDGVIAIGKFSDLEVVRLAEKAERLVFVDSSPAPLLYDSVMVDFFSAVSDVINYLLNRGLRKIGFIGKNEYVGKNKDRIPDLRKESFCLLTKYHGIYDESLIFITDEPTPSSGYEVANRLMGKPIPDAFIVFSDTVALGVLSAFQEAGIRVPEDVSIFSFDDLPMARFTYPSLSTVKIYTEYMGGAAVELLMEQLKERRELPKKVIIPHKLMIRKSSR
ncbi:LacI family DNA-binding transcriptional regulator [Thermicanus aegyptius]|uniref:LacI family DNA-binding transcriptional regulator n=1 Tax=Thermicanus aegyptius TaxID=94009 RepID=UPI000428FDAE|nr:LacI family DNA-binding transcriptional regulator [Thermicanus aegyptius]